MARATARTGTDANLPPEELKAAYDTAMAFPVEEAEKIRLAPEGRLALRVIDKS